MKGLDFPIVDTKVSTAKSTYNLNSLEERKQYFEDKVGPEIKKLNEYLASNTFIAYMLAKKSAGKGTYTRLFMEIFGDEKVAHISVGDIVRDLDEVKTNPQKKKDLEKYLEKNYRGFQSLDELMDALFSRNTKVLLPTEFILALVKRKIDEIGRKVLFIDGFPRNMDQVSYSLYFRELINYRDDPDMFILIDVPEAVIDERMKTRVICPKCSTPRSIKLLATAFAGYDEKQKEFYLMCDNPACNKARMVAKEGDELGIEAIRDRIEMDDKLIKKVFDLHGVPKVFLRNSVPVDLANDVVDRYEITPMYDYEQTKSGEINIIEKPWSVKDDNGIESYSLLAPAVTVAMIRQIAKVLGL